MTAERVTPHDFGSLSDADKEAVLRDWQTEQTRKKVPPCPGKHSWRVMGSIYNPITGKITPVIECSKCPAIKRIH